MTIEVSPGIEIGNARNPFIIAEVGSNWRTLNDCLRSIQEAKNAGANAVKFQLFDATALYGSSQGVTMPGQLPPDWLPSLKRESDRIGIEFMCSAFSPELLSRVNPYVRIHKVASSEMCHLRMLEMLNEMGKPVILSTGAQMPSDIARALAVLKKAPVVLMYCVGAYPAQEVDLRVIDLLAHQFGVPVGYSDHSTDVLHIPHEAVRRGAGILEKHFKATTAPTPDSGHSLDTADFRRMVDHIRGHGPIPVVGPTPAELPMLLRHKRRLIAIRPIEEGDALAEGYNFGIYRSLKDETHAFPPWMVNEVQGRPAMRAIQAGDGIGPGDV